MDNDSIISIISIIILILLSAFFSSAETALVSCNKLRLKTLADENNKRAILLLKILNNQPKMLSTILVGNNIANIGASSITASLTLKLFGNYAVSISAGILTIVILIWGEILPKNIASIHSNTIALIYAPIINFLIILLSPVVFFINSVSNILIKLFNLHVDNTSTITEQEIKAIIDVGEKEGVLETQEKNIIHNILEFTDAKAKEIMTQRIDMVFINIEDTYNKILEVFDEYRFTRLPVYDNTKDEVIGILNIKDLLIKKEEFNIQNYIREPYFTYENKSISDLFIEMKNNNINLAIVLDEYGITAGLITLEDLLEELVGELRDEYDFDECDEITENSDNTYTIDPITKLSDINKYFGINLQSDDCDNLAGYLLEKLDHIPKVGESLEVDNIKFIIQKIENNRLISLTAKKNNTKN